MATAKKATKKTTTKATKKKTAKKSTAQKKATKKSTAKKSPAKKSTAKSAEKKTVGKVLVCAKGKECFWTTDGQVLRDLTELRDALEQMAEEVFTHHVTKDKNDFADWVESVLADAECATALRKSKKPNTARMVVVRHLKYYTQ